MGPLVPHLGQRPHVRGAGVEYGLAAKTEYPHNEYPIHGQLAIEITAWNPKRVDWDNLAIGYKAFQDGLQEVIKRDRLGFEVLGAGVIVDDRQIVKATIDMRTGGERTEIVLRRAE